jgi:hypothetical protein
MSHPDRIARIRIQLDEWQPAIWRRAEVPLSATLKALHDVIQAAMPFDHYHLYEFRADGKRHAIPDPEWDSLRDKPTRRRPCGSARWSIAASRNSPTPTTSATTGGTRSRSRRSPMPIPLPNILAISTGRAPPEDVGGIPGFELFLDAIADPKHEQHRELKRWHGRPFDPEHPDLDEILIRMEKLARRRSLRKAGFEKSRSQAP